MRTNSLELVLITSLSGIDRRFTKLITDKFEMSSISASGRGDYVLICLAGGKWKMHVSHRVYAEGGEPGKIALHCHSRELTMDIIESDKRWREEKLSL